MKEIWTILLSMLIAPFGWVISKMTFQMERNRSSKLKTLIEIQTKIKLGIIKYI